MKQIFSCPLNAIQPEFLFYPPSSLFYIFDFRKFRSPTTALTFQPPTGSGLQVKRHHSLQGLSGCVPLPHERAVSKRVSDGKPQFCSAGQSNETHILKRSGGCCMESMGVGRLGGREPREEAATPPASETWWQLPSTGLQSK